MAGQVDVLEQLAPLRADPSTSTIALDYDGSISPIVEDPATAVPYEGMTEVLLGLANRFGEVLVVSGRPLSYLLQHLPMELSVVGLYGLEGIQKGVRWEHPNGGAWREAIADLAAVARANGPEGMLVEPKDLSLTLHYRTNPAIGPHVEAFAAGLADRAGLRLGRAKMSVELHPPIDADKGTVIERTCADSTAVLFAGDDLGDLPAYEALDRLRMKGIATVKVAVVSDETPDEVIRQVDLQVEGPGGLLELLRSLL